MEQQDTLKLFIDLCTKVPLQKTLKVNGLFTGTLANKDCRIKTMKTRIYDIERKALIDFLLMQSTRSGVSMAVVLSLIAVVVWSSFPNHIVIIWMITGYILNLSRKFVFSTITKNTSKEQLYPWLENSIALMIFLSGVFWGVTCWLFLIPDNLTVFIFVALAVVAAAPSALPAFSVLPYVWFLYAAPLLLITAAKLYSEDLWQLSLLAIINLIGLASLSRNLGDTIRKSITLDIANTELLGDVRIAKDKAEQANLVKSQFLAAVSHDIRQPLHSQGIFLEALSLRLNKKENIDLLDKTIQSNDALNGLFNSLMEISQLDAGTIKTSFTHQSIHDLCQLVVDENHLIAQQKGITLELFGDHCMVITDSILLSRILRNLLSNAIKFSDHGTIKILIKAEANKVNVSVCDSGIGIAISEQKHIFNEYYQINNDARDRSKGIGLGLALVSRMCLLLKHDLNLTSVVGEGSCFSLTLPLGDASKVVNQPKDWNSGSVESLKIILIDDEPSVLEAMTTMLLDWKCFPRAFSSLKEVEQSLEENYQPDLIISDYRLKENTNGLEAIQQLQKRWSNKIPAIIISGDTNKQLLEKINLQDYYLLHKPIKSWQLKKVIRILLNDKDT